MTYLHERMLYRTRRSNLWPSQYQVDANLAKLPGLAQSCCHQLHVPWRKVGWLCWGLTSQSTIFQSCRDRAIASWVINQYFRGVKCLAQGHNTAAVGFEPRTSRSGVRHSTTEPPRSPLEGRWKLDYEQSILFSSFKDGWNTFLSQEWPV